MSHRDRYPAGVPCWVETLQPDASRATEFYRQLFDWDFTGPGPVPSMTVDAYYVAHIGGREVAGIGPFPTVQAPQAAMWTTYISVTSADETSLRALSNGAQLLVAPTDAPPAGRFAVIADPVGAIFGIWEPQDRHGAQIVNEPRAWAMSTLRTPDPETSRIFYALMFGWTTQPLGPSGASTTLWHLPGYNCGESPQSVPRDVVALMEATAQAVPSDEPPPMWSVDFWVTDADQTVRRALASGGRLLTATHDVPGFRRAVVADPAGAAFSISQLRISPDRG